MSWLERIRQRGPDDVRSSEEEPSGPPSIERASPGLAALFERLHDDGRHSILDFGTAGNRQLRLLGRFARRIRFAGLLPGAAGGEALADALDGLSPVPGHPYDVVLAWDVFDRLDAEDRSEVMQRIEEVTAPGARLYAVVASSSAVTRRPERLTLVDLDRVSHEPAGPVEPARPQLLPAHVERLLDPFEVANAFSLRIGLREYVAVKRTES